MSLSARERILKLRETEFKLNKLHNDLLAAERNGGGATSAFMSRFLAHHKELMSLPGRTKNSMPFRHGFEAPTQYIEAPKPPILTLPPNIDSNSSRKLKLFKEPTPNLNERHQLQGVYGNRHPSLALQSLINQLEDQTEKMAAEFPKFARTALLNQKSFLRSAMPLNSMRYVDGMLGLGKNSSTSKTSSGYKDFGKQNLKPVNKSTAVIFSKPKLKEKDLNGNNAAASGTSSKSKVDNSLTNEGTKNESSSTSRSDVPMGFFKSDLNISFATDSNGKKNSGTALNNGILGPSDTRAYSIESSNLMGVILPSRRGGPSSWMAKRSRSQFRGLPILKKRESDSKEKFMSAQDALQLLRRRDRELPQRKKILEKTPQPHQRGLIGVEISAFDPQCTYFYRDRTGIYNPHLRRPLNLTSTRKLPATTAFDLSML